MQSCFERKFAKRDWNVIFRKLKDQNVNFKNSGVILVIFQIFTKMTIQFHLNVENNLWGQFANKNNIWGNFVITQNSGAKMQFCQTFVKKSILMCWVDFQYWFVNLLWFFVSKSNNFPSGGKNVIFAKSED